MVSSAKVFGAVLSGAFILPSGHGSAFVCGERRARQNPEQIFLGGEKLASPRKTAPKQPLR